MQYDRKDFNGHIIILKQAVFNTEIKRPRTRQWIVELEKILIFSHWAFMKGALPHTADLSSILGFQCQPADHRQLPELGEANHHK